MYVNGQEFFASRQVCCADWLCTYIASCAWYVPGVKHWLQSNPSILSLSASNSGDLRRLALPALSCHVQEEPNRSAKAKELHCSDVSIKGLKCRRHARSFLHDIARLASSHAAGEDNGVECRFGLCCLGVSDSPQ